MAKFERQLNARASELAAYLDGRMGELDYELVDAHAHREREYGTYLYVYAGSGVTLTVQIIAASGDACVTAISADAEAVSTLESMVEEYLKS